MIPKVIHYCWFGRNPLPADAVRCINSWKKFCPDYEIKEWNEDNFDLSSCLYVKQAYENKKWAFVSDYARFKILYDYGGIYFDTDVEIVRSIDELTRYQGFMGVEKGSSMVAPGLGIGFEPKNGICKDIIDHYEKSLFIDKNGKQSTKIVLDFATDILEGYGYSHDDNRIQDIGGVKVFPYDYFCPIDYKTGVLELTENTYSIHWYSGTWISDRQRKVLGLEKRVSRLFGKKTGHVFERVYTLPERVKNKIKEEGFWEAYKLVKKKIRDRLKSW